MKKIVTSMLLLMSMFLACNSDAGRPEVIVTDPSPPPIEIPAPPPVENPEDPPENDPIEVTLYTGNTIKFYDGNVIWTWKTGNVAKAESSIYSNENILYTLNEYGQTESTKYLATIPNHIKLNGSDAWIVKNVPPAEAQGLGALYRDYTKIYYNSNEYGNWYEREWKTSEFVILNNDVFTKPETGEWYHVNGNKTDVKTVIENGFASYDYNSSAHTATIDGIEVEWVTNFMNSANHWLESAGTWFSKNGYTWDGAVLVENGSIMTEWRMAPYLTEYTESPVLISAGSHYENSEYVLYWIECNSGWVIQYIPSVDQMSLHVRLYTGDGFRTTGLYYQNLLKPIVIGDYLYFIFEAQVYRYNFSSGLTALFASGVSEVWGY